jgi:hypothetical protein
MSNMLGMSILEAVSVKIRNITSRGSEFTLVLEDSRYDL